ncbi:heat-inducible transcriptional repressor HrcA [Staphylococcus sp. SQ8-PEA]|uniref:Heat-inducible transcription repressor HrcA n=1 Tax=Staphylococcus marylandisciuri TaxID=2981529 RepID=A0ABT2QQZ2_9STAP|nr:heat-inducible transcriptional repressor HrcA [Staphylococcus marylandisciuri]MCU5746400.1 heat-inducible transcriptional repressor HrcA [Staphylococcus marylandisciuri]
MITQRQLSILNAIVEDYVDLGQPVGSKTLIERHNLNVSAATIRNEMKVLESIQLIEKTHLSSGRCPSQLGFRYHVNYLLNEASQQQHSKSQRLKTLMASNHYNVASALSEFAEELSKASQYTTLVMRPDFKQDIINDIQLVRANAFLVIMIVVFTSGHVEHLHLASQAPLTNEELTKIANFVSAQFKYQRDVSFENEINTFTNSPVERDFIKNLVSSLEVHINEQSNGIFTGGKFKLIDALDETNVSSIQPILQYIESHRIINLLENMSDKATDVKIGDEIDNNLSDISIITSDYHIDNNLRGRIAVIGPTAMRYQNVIQLLNAIW